MVPLVTWGVTSAREWINDKLNPKQDLSAVVKIPTPAAECHGGRSWVFDKRPPELPLPPKEGDLDGWAAANGGIPASGNYIEVTLQGLNGRNVIVHDISVNIVSRTDPPHGAFAELSGGCGGFFPYHFSLNLDANPISVTAKPDDGVGAQAPSRPVELPHEISGSEPEVWRLAAETKTCTCEWTATLDWTADDGKNGTTEINDKGHPFRVAAADLATSYFADRWEGRWEMLPA
ncbi:MAG TPA: hypothetical protein VKI00_24120 [Mycobacterium sp.]|uniref:hypothetical protein n=1 Tax=Mycobacterium sp. TaxID=1785 RepID=UPI002C9458A8|nr:hypothetical protein [Mycobacterium sp.]HME78621.1 hypothetical protein [Mycobacterium sp.]